MKSSEVWHIIMKANFLNLHRKFSRDDTRNLNWFQQNRINPGCVDSGEQSHNTAGAKVAKEDHIAKNKLH